MKPVSPSMMPFRLFSCKPVTMLSIGLSPSFCWFASGFRAVTRLSYSSSGAACALKTFASFALVLSCMTSILLGARQSYSPPHAAHHQQHCFFLLLLPSPCPHDTHHMQSSKGKQLRCKYTSHNVTLPTPDTSAKIILKKSVLFRTMSCAMLRRPTSSEATLSQAS